MGFIAFIIYYLVIPIGLIYFVQWFFKKYAKPLVRPEIAVLYEQRPIEKKWFRLVRYDGSPDMPPVWVADYEKQLEAVDAAYLEREKAQKEGSKVRFLVLNDKGEFLEEVDA